MAKRGDMDLVRTEVRRLLESSQAFQALGPDQQRELAGSMVRIGTYLADPSWLDASTPARARALSDSDPVTDLKGRLAEKPGQVGAEFKAGAVREGVEQFGEMVNKVDFPAFVAGLVNGVFRAVVDASMEQMRAYGELLSATAMTVEQFASDHISEGQARDYVAQRYPGAVVVDTSQPDQPARLRPAPDGDDQLAELGRQFNLPNLDLEDEAGERALMAAARIELARSRQQLMATMVLLGINRIVVTNGRINAKVVFDMRASDQARRQAQASMHDEQRQKTSAGAVTAGSVGMWGGAAYAHTTSSHVATVSSAVDDTSQSKAEVKAQLSGDVRLSFKSETFPLERMVDAGGLAMLEQRAQPAPLAGQAPATPAGPQRSS